VTDLTDLYKENCRKARAAMLRAREQHFAIGAFNIDNMETLTAIAKAAQKHNAPVMIEVSQGEVDALGLENVRDLVDNAKTEYCIEMYLNLDHSPRLRPPKKQLTLVLNLYILMCRRPTTMLATKR